MDDIPDGCVQRVLAYLEREGYTLMQLQRHLEIVPHVVAARNGTKLVCLCTSREESISAQQLDALRQAAVELDGLPALIILAPDKVTINLCMFAPQA